MPPPKKVKVKFLIKNPMFFGASLYCGFNAIQSFAKGFKILKTTLQDVVSQESPQDQYFRGVIADEINAIVAENIEEVVQVDEMSQFTQIQKPTTFSEKVNSKSDLLGNLVKKDKIDFTSEIVEKVYEFLPSEQKYILDEAGNVLELDPVGVIRTALEIMEYQLDPAWYAWGTKSPKIVDLKNIIYRGTQYEDILTKCENAGFELVTTENEWLNLILHKGEKFPSQLKVEVRCKTEGAHVTKKMVTLIEKHGCKHCNGRYKNQRITHAISEALFKQKFGEEVKLIDILKEVGTDSKYQKYRRQMDVFRMRVDTYLELNIKDKNGKFIKLAIEAQGPQHKNTEKGFKSFLYLNRFDGEIGDMEWHTLKLKWETSLLRDQLKRTAFKNNNKHGYYLIEVDNDIKDHRRAQHILDEIYKQTGVDLTHLAENININDIRNRLLS